MKRIVFDRAALHSSASLAAPFAVPNRTGVIRWCFLGLFGASGGEPGPPATSFHLSSGPKKKRSFLLLLRIPADLKGGRRRAVEERADLLRTGGRALQGRAASEREREREREKERLLGVGFGNDDAPGQVSPFRENIFFWVLVGSGATTTTTPPPSPLFVSWEFTRRWLTSGARPRPLQLS